MCLFLVAGFVFKGKKKKVKKDETHLYVAAILLMSPVPFAAV